MPISDRVLGVPVSKKQTEFNKLIQLHRKMADTYSAEKNSPPPRQLIRSATKFSIP